MDSIFSIEANLRCQVCGLVRHLRLKLALNQSVASFALAGPNIQ
jgi:hypothetical protein